MMRNSKQENIEEKTTSYILSKQFDEELSMHRKILRNIQKRQKEKLQFHYLSLRNTHLSYIPKSSSDIISKLINIRYLDLSECNLKSLYNFPSLPQVEKVDLTMNKIDDHQAKYLYMDKIGEKELRSDKLPKILILYLSENFICNKQTAINVVEALTTLQEVDFQDNPVSQDKFNYQSMEIFRFNANLLIVDRYTKMGEDMQCLEYQNDDEAYERIDNQLSTMVRGQIQHLFYTPEDQYQWEKFIKQDNQRIERIKDVAIQRIKKKQEAMEEEQISEKADLYSLAFGNTTKIAKIEELLEQKVEIKKRYYQSDQGQFSMDEEQEYEDEDQYEQEYPDSDKYQLSDSN